MPYKTEWYIEGQVVYAEIWGVQALEELHRSNSEMLRYLNSVDGRLVHVIMNDEKLVKVPVSLMQMQKVLTYAKHPQLGWVTMFGDKEKSVKMAAEDIIMSLLARITRAHYIRFKTFDEAVRHLKSVDETIRWEAVNPEHKSQSTSGT